MAELLARALPQYAPTTNHYRLDDGRHVLVTRADDELPVPEGLAPILGTIKVTKTEPSQVEVFLCDENAVLIDADGDPTNGMTALLSLPPGTSFDEAVEAAKEALT